MKPELGGEFTSCGQTFHQRDAVSAISKEKRKQKADCTGPEDRDRVTWLKVYSRDRVNRHRQWFGER
ncbi:hypothetical protein GCM10007382_11230 [Salinibacterium xinjiangense]|nr:hypothetical protein GCM10007382_11230 [Salinibacterium xinjiangense]